MGSATAHWSYCGVCGRWITPSGQLFSGDGAVSNDLERPPASCTTKDDCGLRKMRSALSLSVAVEPAYRKKVSASLDHPPHVIAGPRPGNPSYETNGSAGHKQVHARLQRAMPAHDGGASTHSTRPKSDRERKTCPDPKVKSKETHSSEKLHETKPKGDVSVTMASAFIIGLVVIYLGSISHASMSSLIPVFWLIGGATLFVLARG
jgi:hypothetical protein